MPRLSFRSLGIFAFLFRTSAAVRRATRMTFRSLGIARRSSSTARARFANDGGNRPPSSRSERRGWGGRRRLSQWRRRTSTVSLRGGESLEGRRVLAVSSLAGYMPDLVLASDSGFDGADNYTNAQALTINFNPAGVNFNANAGAGETLQLLVNGSIAEAKNVPDGLYAGPAIAFTVPNLSIPADGLYSISVRTSDGLTTGTPSSTLAVTIDRTSPTISSQTPPTSTTAFTPTQAIDFQVTWDEPVYTSATAAQNGGAANPAGATLPLVIGTIGSTASPIQNATATVLGGAASGSGTPTLTFRHIVANPDNNDADGVQVFAQLNTPATGSAVWLGGRAVDFTDAGELVTLNNHGLGAGAIVSFSAINNTTGIATNTDYFVINPAANTFQLASTRGGTPLPLATNGTGTLNGQLNFINVTAGGTGYSSTNPRP